MEFSLRYKVDLCSTRKQLITFSSKSAWIKEDRKYTQKPGYIHVHVMLTKHTCICFRSAYKRREEPGSCSATFLPWSLSLSSPNTSTASLPSFLYFTISPISHTHPTPYIMTRMCIHEQKLSTRKSYCDLQKLENINEIIFIKFIESTMKKSHFRATKYLRKRVIIFYFYQPACRRCHFLN